MSPANSNYTQPPTSEAVEDRFDGFDYSLGPEIESNSPGPEDHFWHSAVVQNLVHMDFSDPSSPAPTHFVPNYSTQNLAAPSLLMPIDPVLHHFPGERSPFDAAQVNSFNPRIASNRASVVDSIQKTSLQLPSNGQVHGFDNHTFQDPISISGPLHESFLLSASYRDVDSIAHSGQGVPSHSNAAEESAAVSSSGGQLSSIPQELKRYGPYSRHFSSVADAKSHLSRPRWRPALEYNIPQSDEQKEPYVERLYNAMVDFNGFHDRVQSKNKLNKLVDQRYDPIEIEARCWEAIDAAVDLHLRGSCVREAADPTREIKSHNRRGGPVEDRKLMFESRINEICETVKLHKAAATDILDGTKLYSVVYGPILARRTKGDNRANNDKKQRNHERHKSILAEQALLTGQATRESSRKRKASEDIEGEGSMAKLKRLVDFE